MTPLSASPDQLVQEALDLIALGYPVDGTFDEKATWMLDLQAVLEARAGDVRDAFSAAARTALRDDD